MFNIMNTEPTLYSNTPFKKKDYEIKYGVVPNPELVNNNEMFI